MDDTCHTRMSYNPEGDRTFTQESNEEIGAYCWTYHALSMDLRIKHSRQLLLEILLRYSFLQSCHFLLLIKWVSNLNDKEVSPHNSATNPIVLSHTQHDSIMIGTMPNISYRIQREYLASFKSEKTMKNAFNGIGIIYFDKSIDNIVFWVSLLSISLYSMYAKARHATDIFTKYIALVVKFYYV
jgi:hypothetical protein